MRRSLHLLIERWNGSTVQLLDVLLKVTLYCFEEDGRLFMIYCWHLYNWCYINIKYLLSDSIYVNSLQMIIFFQLQWTCSRNINQKQDFEWRIWENSFWLLDKWNSKWMQFDYCCCCTLFSLVFEVMCFSDKTVKYMKSF